MSCTSAVDTPSEHSYAQSSGCGRGNRCQAGAWPAQCHMVAELGWETCLLVLGSSPLPGWMSSFLGNGLKVALIRGANKVFGTG